MKARKKSANLAKIYLKAVFLCEIDGFEACGGKIWNKNMENGSKTDEKSQISSEMRHICAANTRGRADNPTPCLREPS